MAVTMTTAVFWDIKSQFVPHRNHVTSPLESPAGTPLAVISKICTRDNVVTSSPILVKLMMEAIRSSETSVMQEPHGVTSQKTAFL
jgi:hypothetical protein